jgi:hypothetical protein
MAGNGAIDPHYVRHQIALQLSTGGTCRQISGYLTNKKVASEHIMASKFEGPKSDQSLNLRESHRSDVAIRAELLVSGGPRFIVSVIDLSRNGFRIETGNYIPEKTIVYLNIPSMQSLQARIAWQDRVFYGCTFTKPLHESIFEHVSKQHPLLVY